MGIAARDLFLAPGELLLASTGVTKALRPGPVRINQETLGRADPVAMEKAITRRLMRWLKGTPHQPAPDPEFDYDEVCDLLPRMDQEANNVENVAGFQTQFLADQYAQALGVAVGYIKREIPDKVAPAVVAGQRLRASDHAVAEFRRKYLVLEKPLRVLDSLAMGWLVDEEVDALADVYPAIYEAINVLVLPCMAEASNGKPHWRLPFAKDLQLGILIKQTRFDGDVHASLLKTWEEVRAKEAKGAKAPQTKARKGIGDVSTQQERLEAK